jgi:uncharacterized repeat protein (TIGR01451 family)
MSLSDLRFWAAGVLVAVILPFGSATRGQSTPAKRNKVLVYPTGTESVSQLKERGIDRVLNYGSYWVVEATDDQVASLNASYGKRAMKADYLNKVELAATCLDTTAGEPTIPSHLQQSVTAGKRLRLVQFQGPVLPEWMKQLESAGKVVSYIPNNTYVVWLDQDGEAKLKTQMVPSGPIQWIGQYHPYYKIPKDLLTVEPGTQGGTISVRVAVVADSGTAGTANRLQALGFMGSSLVRNGQEIFEMDLSPSAVSQIAQLPEVLWIEKVERKRLLDEVQGLVLAGQTNGPGHGPSTTTGITNYLEFVTNTVGGGMLSFADPTTYPVVDIADTGLDTVMEGYPYPDHPSFYYLGDVNTYYSRVVYSMPPWLGGDPLSQLGCQTRINEKAFRGIEAEDIYYDTGGHGTRVASVVAGYDDGTNKLNQSILELRTVRTNMVVVIPDPSATYPGNIIDCTIFNSGAGSPTTTNLSIEIATGVANVCPPFVLTHTNIDFTITSNQCDSGGVIYTNNVPWTEVWTNSSYSEFHRDPTTGFRYGMGISPFGLIGINRIWSQNISLDTSDGGCLPVYDPISICVNDIPAILGLAYDMDARIQNNSWADSLDIHFVNGGIYNSDCQTYDIAVRDAILTPQVGTNGVTPGPSPLNQEFAVVFATIDAGSAGGAGGFVDMLVTAPSTAKNIISVGTAENAWFGYDSLNMYPSSGVGPTVDGRFKPEIVAPGIWVYGATSQQRIGGNDPEHCSMDRLIPTTTDIHIGPDPTCGITVTNYSALYTYSGGSSYAAPAVSGSIQLLWWYFQNRLTNEVGQALFQPSPAMAKAYLCNSARYMPVISPQTGTMDTLPSILQGMGELDLQRMFDGVPRVIRDESVPRAIDVPLMTTNSAPQQTYFSQGGQSYEVSGQVLSNDLPFRVTLAWTDVAGNPNVFKQLVNDLDLNVIIGGQAYKGNVFSASNSVVGGGFDVVNNMESVFLPAGQTGTWKVVVQAMNVAGDGVPNVGSSLDQDFALVVYNSQTNFTTLSDVPNLATNNSCQTAIVITDSPFSFTNTLSKATATGTNGYNNVHPSPSAGRGGADEFFKLNLPTPGGVFTIDTTGSSFYNVLSVWRVQVVPQTVFVRGECGALVEVTSNAGGTSPSQVTFTADGSNDYYIVVEPQNDGPGGTLMLNVNATATAITVTPSPLVFPDQIVSVTSAVQTVTYQNNTTVKVGISSVSITGSNAADFVIELQGCAGGMGPGQNCGIGIAFAPTANGIRNAQLVIYDDATGSPRIVPLRGYGLQDTPFVCVGGSLAFGNLFVGRTSPVQSITVTNCGTAALVVGSATITGVNAGDFAIASSSCSSVSPGGNCTIGVTFTPTAAGARNAVLAINDNAPGSPHSVLLSGTGVGCTPITVFPSVLPTPSVGIPYSQGLTVSGATLPVTFALAIGSTPGVLLPGLSLTNGVISGTATAVGTFSFKVAVTDANGCTGVKWYSVSITCPTITISPPTLPGGQWYVAYSQTNTAAGGVSPYTYAVTGGSLPSGMSLSGAGVLSGTPTSNSLSSAFIVTATDTNRCQGSKTYTLTLADPPQPPITNSCPTITVTPAALPNGTVSNAYSRALSASGGTVPYSFAVTAGTLPGGLALSSAGTLSGTPSGAGSFNFTVTATDTKGCQGSRAYNLVVSNPAPVSAAPDLQVSINASSTPVFVLDNVTYTVTVTNAGSATATGVSLTDTLPVGAELVSATTPYSQSVGAIGYSLGTLPVGVSAQVTIVVKADKAGTLVNSATVAANESEPNIANNSVANSAVTVIPAANVDLTGTGQGVLQTGKQSAKPTYSITAKLTCLNQGEETSPAAKVRFYLSSSSSLGSGAVVLGKDLSTGRLKAGKSRQLTLRAKLPANAAGQYVIAVIDPGNVVAESDKTNNTIVMGPIP